MTEATKAAVLTDNKKTTRNQRKMATRTLTSLIEQLQDQAKRSKDLLVPYNQLRAEVESVQDAVIDDEGNPQIETSYRIVLACGEKGRFPLFDQTLGQICVHTKTDAGKKTTLGKNYLNVLLEDANNLDRIELAATNINHWFTERSGEQHFRGRNGEKKAVGEKQVLIRTLFIPDREEYVVRALLSDHYFIYNSIDMVTAALGVIAGKDGPSDEIGETLQSMAKGARVFDWHMDPFSLKLGFVNPGFAFDLKNPDKGVIEAEVVFDKDIEGTQHKFIYPGGEYGSNGWARRDDNGGGGGCHMVFPACFISNSETGGGSASVEMMFLEAACDNSAKLGISAKRVHHGARMEDDFESDRTRHARVKLVTSQFADSLHQVFDKTQFEENCRKFLGLFEQKVKDVEETFKYACSQMGVTEDILSDLLKSYEQFNQGADTVGDVQRAITNVAQDKNEEIADAMVTYAGELVNGNVKVKKDLLVTA